MPDEAELDQLLEEARAAEAARNARRFRGAPSAEASAPGHDDRPLARLVPVPVGSVVVRASSLLGIDGAIHHLHLHYELGRTMEHWDQLLELIRGAAVVPGPGDVDLGKLERALETGHGLPRDAEAQLLEVVRELIRWRSAAGKRDGG